MIIFQYVAFYSLYIQLQLHKCETTNTAISCYQIKEFPGAVQLHWLPPEALQAVFPVIINKLTYFNAPCLASITLQTMDGSTSYYVTLLSLVLQHCIVVSWSFVWPNRWTIVY